MRIAASPDKGTDDGQPVGVVRADDRHAEQRRNPLGVPLVRADAPVQTVFYVLNSR